ncbi:MAG: hypothetical protein ACW98X_21295 [Promethearchaeota archaeon]|jgi:hypothetical protein
MTSCLFWSIYSISSLCNILLCVQNVNNVFYEKPCNTHEIPSTWLSNSMLFEDNKTPLLSDTDHNTPK